VALPELFANPSTPGTASSLTTLGAAVSDTTGTTITTSAAAPTALQASGQFRIVIDSEIMIVTAGASGTSWTVVRGAESSVAATHTNGTNIYHVLTAGAMAQALAEPMLCNGRLTLTSGTPVTTADVTGATTIYFTPYAGNLVALYDGSQWANYVLTEISLALGTLTSGKNYDVFLYNNAGTLTLEALVWTDDTTRATALVKQDGVLCKTGALTRRYLGTFRTTATTTTEDSAAKRFVWNYYNRVPRPMRKLVTTTWTYATASWRQANADTTMQLDFVQGVAESLIEAQVAVNFTVTVNGASLGIGLDSTTSPSTSATASQPANGSTMVAFYRDTPVAGRHTLVWLEFGSTGGTFGGNSLSIGMTGTVQG